MEVLRYNDKKIDDQTKIPGFATLFKMAKKEDKFFGWFPNAGDGLKTEEAWINFFNGIRQERFNLIRKITNKKAFYRFLRSSVLEDYNDDGIANEFFYCIPRGFTKSEAMSLENDHDGDVLQTVEGFKFTFTKVRKITEGIGICILTK